jgi:hypothetical protein
VSWGSTSLATTYVSASQLAAAVPASLIATAGTASVTVSGASNSAPFTIIAPPPTITSLSPASATAGSAAFTLIVNGDNFTSTTTVSWGSASLATTYVSASQLTAAVPASLIATAGTASVTVSGASNSAAFTIISPPPTIASLSPASATAGSAAFTLTVNGANFTSTTTVSWGSTSLATTYVSASQLAAAVTASLIATAGTASVTVSGASNSAPFTIIAPPPTITSLSPASATAGSAAFTLTVNGANFTSTTTVSWGSTSLATTYVSASQLAATVPASLIASAGTASVTVSGASNSAPFTIIAPPPTITSLSPASATAGSAAFTLTVNGDNFTSATTVSWGSTSLATTYVSASQLAAAVPASLIATAGTASLTVTSDGGTSAPVTFPVLAMPVLIRPTPFWAIAGGDSFTMIINGSNFLPTSTTVRWLDVSGGTTSLSATYISPTQLSVVIPASLIVTASYPRAYAYVSIYTPGGYGWSNETAFAICPVPPAITSLTPSSVNADSAAFTLTVNGANFTSDTTVIWGSASLATTFVSASQLTAAVPASLIATAGTAHVTVSNTVSGASISAPFTIISILPTITSTSPTSVLASIGTFTLTINGSNFLPGPGATVASWDYTALATTYISSTQITAVVPASLIPSARTLGIIVSTSNGVSSYFAFTINPPKPVITSLTSSNIWAAPGTATVGQGDFILYVYGNYFDTTAVVNWGSTPLVTTYYINASMVAAVVPASLTATAGTVSLTVTSDGGTSVPITYPILAMPNINNLRPNWIVAGGDSFTLIINGSNFLPTSTTVRWLDVSGGVTFLSATYISSTQLSVEVPAILIANAGMPYVSVYTPGGYGWTSAIGFTIIPATLAITSLTPTSVNAGGPGFSLTITGTAFAPDATTVLWGTTSLSTVNISPTQLTVAVPASLIEFSGTGSITVTTANGASAPVTFTVNHAPPAISTLSPSLVIAGGSAITLSISGEYFTPASIVNWGSTALATTVISQNQLQAVVPASLIAGAGTASVSVTTSAGTSVSLTFTINPVIKITTTTLPPGTAGNAYSGPINVIGGFPGYSWTVSGLPDSMTYFNTNDSTLTITGTPASPGAITFQVSVQDTAGASAGPVNYTINIAAGPNGANNVSLNGNYVCMLQGSVDTDGTRWASLISFQADSQGNFTGGVFDTNSYDIGSSSGVMTGSYSIGADNNGMASIHTILTNDAAGIQTTKWAIALSGAAQPAQQFRMIEADDLGTLPSYQQGTANCYLATTSAFSASTISGSSFAFGLDGEDHSGNMKSAAGLFSASGGKITNGNIDMAQGGIATVQTAAFTATYTAPDPTSGRFTMNLSGAGNSTGFTVYIIDANRMFVLDNTNNDGEQAGSMRAQQQSSYSAESISGPFVLYMRGAEFNSSGNTPSGFYADVFQGTGDGAGNITINQSYTDDAGVYSARNSNNGPAALAFDSVHPGRATFQSASGTTYLYLFNNNSAFEIGVGNNGSVESGWLESQSASQSAPQSVPQAVPQALTSSTSEALAGNFLFGDLSQLNIEPTSSVGVLGVTSSGTINATLSTASRGNLSWDQSSSTTYSWDATAPGTGTFLIANGAQAGASCAVISPTKFVCASQTDPAPSVEVFEQ